MTETPEQRLLWESRRRAKLKGVPHTITVADIAIPLRCPALGILLSRNVGGRGPNPDSPSLDRINPALGYVPGNVQVLSIKANLIKQNATPEELERVAAHMRKTHD